jgi:elongation factor G
MGAISRKGKVRDGNAIGDGSPEARTRQMSTELNIATAAYLGETWTFLDCPGFIELAQDAYNALMIVDTAVVVCEPEPEKALTLAPLLRFLDDQAIPHIIFINKMDLPGTSIRASLEALQSLSDRPLVLREIPIHEGEKINGFVDLVSERAFRWTEGQRSELIHIPESVSGEEREARVDMLESIADFDDKLLEMLLEDTVPGPDEIYAGLSRDLQEDLIVPVFFGSAECMHGITRLLKALRHEAPEPSRTLARLSFSPTEPCAQVFKTLHASHTGKLSFVRVWHGEVVDGSTINGERVSSVNRVLGQKLDKQPSAVFGEVAALGRLESAYTGGMLGSSSKPEANQWPQPLKPMFALAVHVRERIDEVKLSGALARLVDEDPSLSYGHDQDTGEFLLWGQGEMHILIALDRLRNRFNIQVSGQRPQVPYKETIRTSVSQHARHKKQSGGHGEFGDIVIEIKPLPRGAGFQFSDKITGGAVPKQYIPAVEAGVKEYLARGPLTFPVVDIAVTLLDGQYHSVDSSDMAFRKAAHLAMREGMSKCSPVLLEPINHVKLTAPTEFTSRMQRIVSGRRGQILGFEPRIDWKGWDEISVLLPQAEMHGLIIEIRSATLGVGTFEWQFDHLQELSGKLADEVVSQRLHASQEPALKRS